LLLAKTQNIQTNTLIIYIRNTL